MDPLSLTNKPDLSVVIPIHNEESLLTSQIKDISRKLTENGLRFEVILVENGSRDRTFEIGKYLVGQDKRLQLIQTPKADYGLALRTGLLEAAGRIIVNYDLDFYDLDFACQALALEPFGYDVIIASKNMRLSKDHRKLIRRLISSIYKYVLYYAFGLNVADTHGIKAWRNDEKLKQLIVATSNNREIFDTELIIRSQYQGRKLLELPTEVSEMRQSVTPILPRAWRGLVQIIGLWFQLKVKEKL